MNILGSEAICHFSRKSDSKKEKRVVLFTHEPDIFATKHSWTTFSLRKQRTFGDATTCFPARLRLRETSTKIPYWWRVTPHIWVVLLIGWIKFPTPHDQSEALPRSSLPRSGEWRIISTEFLRSFLRRHLAGESVVASPSVGCFLSLDDIAHSRPLFVGNYLQVTWWAFGQWKGKKIALNLHSNKR